MVAFLPLNLASQDRLATTATLCSALRGPVGLFDLETGSVIPGPIYGVKAGSEALSPYCGRVLLIGLLDPAGRYAMLGGEDESLILEEFFLRLDDWHSNGAALAGHNIAGFDLPFVAGRARATGVRMPEWFLTAATSRFSTGIIDTYRLFSPGAKFPRGGISLGSFAKLVGRPFEAHGAHFEKLWADRAMRPMLMEYCAFNVLDSAMLYGLCGGNAVGTLDASLALVEPLDWPLPTGERLPTQPEARTRVFAWITVPAPGAAICGPHGKGWKEGTSEAAIDQLCRTQERQNPLLSRIVGWTDGKDAHLYGEHEAIAIADGLRQIGSWAESKVHAHVDAPADFAGFTALRLARLGGVFPAIPAVFPLPPEDLVRAWSAARRGGVAPDYSACEPAGEQGHNALQSARLAGALLDENPALAAALRN